MVNCLKLRFGPLLELSIEIQLRSSMITEISKDFLDQVWSDPTIAPTASLTVWWQYRTFNGS